MHPKTEFNLERTWTCMLLAFLCAFLTQLSSSTNHRQQQPADSKLIQPELLNKLQESISFNPLNGNVAWVYAKLPLQTGNKLHFLWVNCMYKGKLSKTKVAGHWSASQSVYCEISLRKRLTGLYVNKDKSGNQWKSCLIQILPFLGITAVMVVVVLVILTGS